MKENRMQWHRTDLIEQIIEGRKTASVAWLHWREGYSDYNTPLRIGEYYTVHDRHGDPRCRIRLVGLEICRWDDIPERLWKGETNFNADEFRAEHVDFFDHPSPDFEFVALYFHLT
jgi:uncharacterized protein YhfF